ncbi:hypothetical protein BKG57_21985 [Mycobacteroides chelonae]|nr:hypothetical protein BKG57_21985 [Mycobacteroides chelonae]
MHAPLRQDGVAKVDTPNKFLLELEYLRYARKIIVDANSFGLLNGEATQVNSSLVRTVRRLCAPTQQSVQRVIGTLWFPAIL